jgi:hypothetical protein
MERTETEWQQSLNALEVWATDKGYYISFSGEEDKIRDNYICPLSKIIEIDGTLPVETQVYYLLHECGHVLVFENGNYYNRKNLTNDKDETSKEFKVLTILEEAEAWKRGYNLAKRLLIPIEDERWKDEFTDALNKYILWAADIDWENDE